MSDIKKVVLAYSGGLDTSIILKWLEDTYGCEVVTFTADIGQGEEVEPARTKAQAAGLKEIYIEDLREEDIESFLDQAEAEVEAELGGGRFPVGPRTRDSRRQPTGKSSRFPEGGMALIDCSRALQPSCDPYFSLTVIGSTGAAYADDHHNTNLLYKGITRGLPVTFEENWLRLQLESFA